MTITGSPLRTLAATCTASVRKQLTSIQVVLPSPYSPPLPFTRGVQATRKADTAPPQRISTAVPTWPVICTRASIAPPSAEKLLLVAGKDADAGPRSTGVAEICG